jgi:hypothetical protein
MTGDSSSVEYSEDDAPPQSVKYLVNLRHQYDELLREGEVARERLAKFKDLERNVTEWTRNFGFADSSVSSKQSLGQEQLNQKVVEFTIPIRPYENDPDIPHGFPNRSRDDSD